MIRQAVRRYDFSPAGFAAAGFRGAKKLDALPSPALAGFAPGAGAFALASAPDPPVETPFPAAGPALPADVVEPPAIAVAAAAPLGPFTPLLDSNAALFRVSKVGSASELTSMSGSGRFENTSLLRIRATISIRLLGTSKLPPSGPEREAAAFGPIPDESVRGRLAGRSESASRGEEGSFGRVRNRAYGVASFSILPSRR